MRHPLYLASIALIGAAACSNAAPELKDPPFLKVTAPERSLIRAGSGAVEVRGEVHPNENGSPIKTVMVNGVQATVAADGTFTAQIDVPDGATLIHTEAVAIDGGKATDTRAVEAGELRSPGAMVEDAMAVGLSDEAFAALGKAGGTLMKSTDLAPILAPLNPVVKSGLASDGSEDGLYAKISVYDVNMSDAVIDMKPVNEGIAFTLNLKNVEIPMHARYAVAWVDSDTDITATAGNVKVAGIMKVTPSGGAFAVNMENTDVKIDDFHLDASGLPGDIMDIVNFDRAAEYIVEKGAELFMEPMVKDALSKMAGVQTLDVMGKKLDVEVLPTAIFFDPQAAHIALSSRMKVQGTENSKGFIYTSNAALDVNPANGFVFGLADDAANQLLAGFTAAGMLNLSQPVAGGSFDTAQIMATMPPMISADPKDGRMKVIAGDMMMTFTNQGMPVAKAALNLKIDLKVAGTGSDIKVELGKPEVFVDILEDLPNITGFEAADLSRLTALVVDHQVKTIAELLGNVPIPAIGGLMVSNLTVSGDNGYVVIKGDMK